MTAIAARLPSAARFDGGAIVETLLTGLRQQAQIAMPVVLPSSVSEMDRDRSAYSRWMALLALQAAQPFGASDAVVLSVVQAVHADTRLPEIRHELEHLTLRGLVTLRKDTGSYFAELTEQGMAVAGYSAPAPSGIFRPERAW